MTKRIVRVNELVKREISNLIHTFYQSETVLITITEVDVSPDLRHASVYFSVLGNVLQYKEASNFFQKHKSEIRRKLGKNIILKYLPHLKFVPDSSIEKGTRLINKMKNIDIDSEFETTDENAPS